MCTKTIMFGILVNVLVRYLKIISDDLVITYDKIIDSVIKSYVDRSKTAPIHFNEKKATCKIENFYTLLIFLLITLSLLIIYYCLYCIKDQSKQNYIYITIAIINQKK